MTEHQDPWILSPHDHVNGGQTQTSVSLLALSESQLLYDSWAYKHRQNLQVMLIHILRTFANRESSVRLGCFWSCQTLLLDSLKGVTQYYFIFPLNLFESQ